MNYWLIIVFCIAAADEPTCVDRLVDVPWKSVAQCRMAAQALVQSGLGYRPIFVCTTERPDDVPLAPAPTQPGRWA